MASTLRAHHPDAELTVLLLDGDPLSVGEIAHARFVGFEQVAGADAGLLSGANARGALPFAALPYLVRHVLEAGASSVLYLGAGQRLLAPLQELLALLPEHDIVLVARVSAGVHPLRVFCDEPTRGAFSRHLLGFKAGPASAALLSAWPRYFMIAGDEGGGAVRRWLDAVPAIVEGVAVLRDSAYGVDSPMLAERIDSDIAGEELLIDGRAARLVDFSELDADDPPAWLDGGGGIRLSGMPAVRRLVEDQVGDLQAAGWRADVARPQPYMELEDGLRLTDTIRTLLATAIVEGEVTRSPFTAAGRGEFYEHLQQPGDRGGGAGLTRLHIAIWRARDDLRSGYQHIDGPDGSGYAGWLCVHGGEQEGLVQELLPPTPEVAYRDSDPHVHEAELRWGVNVVGFLTAELGVGEAARLLIAGLDARQIPALPIQGQLMPPSRRGINFSYVTPDDAAYPINILCINGDGIPVFAREAGRAFFERRYSIALWWWEAGEPPVSWTPAFELIDEVWVASRYIYDAIAPSSPVPVVQVRLPLVAPEVADRSRAQLGLPHDGFLFLCVHDYHSVAARKNPVAVIDAFHRAFPPGSGAKLVVKSINAGTYPREHARAMLAAGGHTDIALLDDYVPVTEKNAMIAACDCYVSLHRSEGFGIPLAEAMMLGKPVIATRYGGSLEFMNDESTYLVDCKLVPVGDGAYPYAPDAVWAEPDVEHAAALMRHVFSDQQQARKRGQLARRQVLERHAPAVAGEIMERRLELVQRRLREGGVRALDLARVPTPSRNNKMYESIASSPALEVGRGRFGQLKARVYKPVTAWARAHLKHQQIIEDAMQLEIEGIDERVSDIASALHEQQRALHAETLALLRRLEVDLPESPEHESRAS
jgi:glycosyltransferase involved in cell wall biosynthesis